jgi:DNA replication protein DnaC
LAIALGVEAILSEHKVQFYKVSRLVNELVDAKERGTIQRKMNQLEKLDLLIIDEWGYASIDNEGAKLLFQVIADCYEKRSIIITTNLEFGKWNTLFYDEKLTAALIDRMIHHSHLIIFERESYRVKHSLMNEK